MKTMIDYIKEFSPEGLEIVEVNADTYTYRITFRYRGIQKVSWEYNAEAYPSIAEFQARRTVVWIMERFAAALHDDDMLAYWQKSPWYEKRPLSEIYR